MSFDSKKFMKTGFKPREEEIQVPDLKDYFDDGKAVWVIRGLTGVEMGQCNEAAQRNRNIAAILEGLVEPEKRKKVDSMRRLIGIGEIPDDIAKRIEIFKLGSVKPKVDEEFAIKFCETFPVEFFDITNQILKLTGMGHVPGKSKPSGETSASGQA